MTSNKLHAARQLFLQESFGVLSTISVDVPGYPFGSVTPYCVDRDCQPIVYISTIAQHTRNIIANPKVSLTVVEANGESDDVQARGRLTLLADARPVERANTEIRDRYLRYFPSAVQYDGTHDFGFYRLELVRARFIGGFGQIFWLTREELCMKNPFSFQDEARIVQHMNTDHASALAHISGVGSADQLTMTGIDAEGFDAIQSGKKRRFTFDRPVRTMEEARQTLISMSRRPIAQAL
jgi:heme oxygenase (biliverdin-IX-beta and delta-forming)